MVDYTRAIKRPFTDLKKLVIGSILSIIPIVNFIALGYELKCAKSAMDNDFKLPEWNGWWDLFKKGFLAILVMLGYFAPIIIPAIALVILLQMSGSSFLENISIPLLFALLLTIFVVYILPSALMAFVSDDFRFGPKSEAFKIGKVVKKTLNKDYLVTWIVVMVYNIALSIILSFIPIIGTAIASFAAGVTSMTAFGELYPKLKA